MNSIFKKIFIWFSALFVWGLLLAVPGGARAEGSTLYISPGAGSFIIGSTFDVSILLNTGDVSANTIIAELQ